LYSGSWIVSLFIGHFPVKSDPRGRVDAKVKSYYYYFFFQAVSP